jgi:hypothetical protein
MHSNGTSGVARGTPNTAEEWSKEEDVLMQVLYPDKPQIEVMQALPRRAWNRILERAQDLQLRRKLATSLNFNGPHPVNLHHRTMSYSDLEAVAQLIQTEEEKTEYNRSSISLRKNHSEGTLQHIGGSLLIASVLAVLMRCQQLMRKSSMSAHSHA